MNKLEQYSKFVEQKNEFASSLNRANGPWGLGPTNRGGIFFKFNGKDIKNDISPKELRDIRNLINCFLEEVVDN